MENKDKTNTKVQRREFDKLDQFIDSGSQQLQSQARAFIMISSSGSAYFLHFPRSADPCCPQTKHQHLKSRGNKFL